MVATVACNLDLRNYPLDVQLCKVRMLSYSHPENELCIRWFSEQPISYNKHIELPEMAIEDVHPAYCDGEYTYGQTENATLAKGEAEYSIRIYIWQMRYPWSLSDKHYMHWKCTWFPSPLNSCYIPT